MKTFMSHYLVRVIAIGCLSMWIAGMVLFGTRKICNTVIDDLSHSKFKRSGLHIQPSGLVDDLDSRTDNVRPSRLSVLFRDDLHAPPLFHQVTKYIDDKNIQLHSIMSSLNENEGKNKYSHHYVYFDKKTALYVNRQLRPGLVDEKEWTVTYSYAGPKGVGLKPDKELGQFGQPVCYQTGLNKQEFVVYDLDQTRFYRIDFEEKTVIRGEKVTGEFSSIKPIYSNYFSNMQNRISISWEPPTMKADPNNTEKTLWGKLKNYEHKDGNIAILDQTGVIYKLDVERLEIVELYGHMPIMSDYTILRPDELQAYSVVYFVRDDVVKGASIATLSRDGSILMHNTFNEHGYLVNGKKVDLYNFVTKSPGGPMIMTCRYILENLQAPAMGIASYLLRNRISAAAGQSGLFILPDSFVGTIARLTNDPWYTKLLLCFLIIFPSIILSASLATAALNNGKKLGLSMGERKAWFFAIFLLGWTIYVTYLVVRPKGVMVTCRCCGKLRRTERAVCHYCQSGWELSELAVPDWRIIDRDVGVQA